MPDKVSETDGYGNRWFEVISIPSGTSRRVFGCPPQDNISAPKEIPYTPASASLLPATWENFQRLNAAGDIEGANELVRRHQQQLAIEMDTWVYEEVDDGAE